MSIMLLKVKDSQMAFREVDHMNMNQFTQKTANALQRAVDGLERISRHLSLRIGDFLLFELTTPAPFRRGDTLDNISIV